MRSVDVLFVLALASVTIVGCANSDRVASIVPAGAMVTTSTPTPSTTPDIPVEIPEGPTDSGLSVEVWDAANKFNDTAALPFADNYGGITFGFDNVDSLVVFLTERTDSLETQVRDFLVLPEEKVSFRDAAITWEALIELNLRVQADMQGLLDRFHIHSVGIGGPDMKVVVSGPCPLSDGEIAELRDTYGEQVAFELGDAGVNLVDRAPENDPVMPECGD